jgi:hypothetical protein
VYGGTLTGREVDLAGGHVLVTGEEVDLVVGSIVT